MTPKRDIEGVDEVARAEPAVDDASRVLARVEADEREASRAREEIREHGLVALESDPTVAAVLEDGEHVVARRASALLAPPSTDAGSLGYGGAFYVTSRRLLHLGQIQLGVPLEQIRELSLAGERLLLTLAAGEGLDIQTDHPRTLRVLIGAAMAEARAAR